MTNFEDLEVWGACREVRNLTAAIVKKYPPEEKFRLIDQMLKSARSTTANLAEGFGRYHYQENIQYSRQTRGSLYELLDHFITSLDEGFIQEEEYTNARKLIEKAIALVNGYIKYLDRRKGQSKANKVSDTTKEAYNI